jgi:hypothetical protein
LKEILFDGKYKVGILKEKKNEVLILALEDFLISDVNGNLSLLEAGKRYLFCKCCFESYIQEASK